MVHIDELYLPNFNGDGDGDGSGSGGGGDGGSGGGGSSVPAIMSMWYPGQEAVDALVATLLGAYFDLDLIGSLCRGWFLLQFATGSNENNRAGNLPLVVIAQK